MALVHSQLLWRKQGNPPHYEFCYCGGCAAQGKSTFVFKPLDAQAPDFSDLQIIGELLMQISGILAMPHCHLPHETQSPESATTTLHIYQWWIYYYMHCPRCFHFACKDSGGNRLSLLILPRRERAISPSTLSHGSQIGTYSQARAQLHQPLGKHEGVFDRSLNHKRWVRVYFSRIFSLAV